MRRTLVPQRALALNNQSRTFATLPVELDPQTASLTVRIPRPTTANPMAWGSTGRLRVRIVVDCDGVIHTCQGSTRGGVVTDNRRGREGTEATEYSLTWNLPTGFFQKGNEPREQWASFRNKRWGETSKTPLRAWVELDRTAGSVLSQVELVADVEPAPPQEYHSSVAYQNAASAYEASGGDMAISVSFDAGAGTDQVAFVFGSTSRDTRPTGAAVTYDGSISSDLGDVTNTYWRGAGGLAWDSLIGSGAKTVAFTGSGGSGTIYDSFVGVISVTGAHQTTHGTVGTSGADSGTALSITVPGTPASDSLIVDFWTYVQDANWDLGGIGANQTARIQNGVTTRAGHMIATTQSGADGAVMSMTKNTTNWEYVGMAIELKAAAGGGSNYNQSAAGTMGTLSATLVLKTGKALSGVSGSYSATLARLTGKALTGTNGSSSAELAKSTTKSFAGTMGDLSATLSAIKTALVAVSGAVGDLTGSIARQVNKALVGVSGSVSGILSRLISKSFSGADGGLSGALNASAGKFVELAGVAGDLAGTLAKQTLKSLSGVTDTVSGAISKQINKALSGASGSVSGTLSSSVYKVVELAGAVGNLTGTLTRSIAKSLAGTAGSVSGSIAKAISKSFSGTMGALSGSFTTFAPTEYLQSITGSISSITGSVTMAMVFRRAKMKAGYAIRSIINGGRRLTD